MMPRLPIVEIAPLFGAQLAARRQVDAAILAAARDVGFLLITGLPAHVPQGPATRAELLRLFTLPAAAQRALWRQKFEAANPNVYRGWFPVQPGNLTSKEGIDLGADVAYGTGLCVAADPLREPTPLPPESLLPGWHAAVARYYRGMERLCQALMKSIARALGLDADYFDAAFATGLSTLRLLRYPPRTDLELAAQREQSLWHAHAGGRRYVMGAAHVDSGFVTVLAQDGVDGLQARHRDGSWIDVPPAEGTLVVNFGRVLERWSAGRIRATEHRVLGDGVARHSIPFFYEARADAEIRPLPIDPPDAFAPFLFGDYLWATITQFVEFRGMEGLRPPRRA
jgi:isopenicillin N synthase-like dioxygenase